jgi:hypothetical protein
MILKAKEVARFCTHLWRCLWLLQQAGLLAFGSNPLHPERLAGDPHVRGVWRQESEQESELAWRVTVGERIAGEASHLKSALTSALFQLRNCPSWVT